MHNFITYIACASSLEKEYSKKDKYDQSQGSYCAHCNK